MKSAQMLGRLLQVGMISDFKEGIFGEGTNISQAIEYYTEKVGEFLETEDPDGLSISEDSAFQSLVNACIDSAVLGILSEDTLNQLAELPDDSRKKVKYLHQKLSGRTDCSGGRWVSPLWCLKKFVEHCRRVSPSKFNNLEDITESLKEFSKELILVVRLNLLRDR